MSFSADTKNELAHIMPEKKNCMIAEIAAFIRVRGNLRLMGGGKFEIQVPLDDPAIARHFMKLIKEYFSIETHLTVRETGAISILWGDRSLFLRAPKLRLAGAETLFPLAGGDAARWRFTARQVEIHAEREGLRVRLTAAVAEDEPGVFLTFTFAADTE